MGHMLYKQSAEIGYVWIYARLTAGSSVFRVIYEGFLTQGILLIL